MIPSRRILRYIYRYIARASLRFSESGGILLFEHRPSGCGHCVQDFLADLDLRDLPGEAAGLESGAGDALPTADLRRFYPAALVVAYRREGGIFVVRTADGLVVKRAGKAVGVVASREKTRQPCCRTFTLFRCTATSRARSR